MPSETSDHGATEQADARSAPTTPHLPAALLARQRERFASALALLLEQVRGLLAEHDAFGDAAGTEESTALGGFADGRIDPARFAALFAGEPAVDDATARELRAAFELLSCLSARLEQLCAPRLEPGETLRDAVDRALAEIGRAFAAARAVARLRSGAAAGSEARAVAGPIGPFAFRLWSRAERELAPPLVIEVDGADLGADALAEFLDGSVKMALVVRGPAAPAPLVRLVSPGVFVAQADDAAQLARLEHWPGPAVVALLPTGAATFVHDPARGPALADRLSILTLPESPQVLPLGGRSPRQQSDELAQLRALAGIAKGPSAAASRDGAAERVGVAVPAESAPLAAADPANALAAWLVGQADLADL